MQPDAGTEQATTLLRDNHDDVAIVTGSQPVQALVDGSNLFAAQSSVAVLNKMGGAVHTTILFNPQLKTSWVMIPAIIGLILTFIGTIVTSIGMVRERQTGTLEQLAVMPIKPSSVILGKITPYFLVAAIDLAIVTGVGMALFGCPSTATLSRSPSVRRSSYSWCSAWGVHLDHLAERRAGDSDGFLLPAAADPAVRDDLPARRDGGRGALDRLPAAADLLR